MIGREKENKGILVFTALIHKDTTLLSRLEKLSEDKKENLIQDIRVFCASKDMGYGGAWWSTNKLTVQHALPLDSQISAHLVDLKAKEVINAVIGIHSLIRKTIVSNKSNNKDS